MSAVSAASADSAAPADMEPEALHPTARPWPGVEDPLESLAADHELILRVLAAADAELRRIETDGVVRDGFWQQFHRFTERFDFAYHHVKEEQLLFPALERSGLGTATGPTAVLRDEHRHIEAWLARIEAALQQRDRIRLAAAVSGYLTVTNAHLLKENRIVFPLARHLLAPDERARLFEQFERLTPDAAALDWALHLPATR